MRKNRLLRTGLSVAGNVVKLIKNISNTSIRFIITISTPVILDQLECTLCFSDLRIRTQKQYPLIARANQSVCYPTDPDTPFREML